MSKYDAYSFGLRSDETPGEVHTVFRCLTEDRIGVSNREWTMLAEMASHISDILQNGGEVC